MTDALTTVEPGAVLPVFAGWFEQLANLPDDLSETELIDAIGDLERLKSACAAAQAQLTAQFADARLGDLKPGSQAEARARGSVASEIGLARRESPSRGSRHLGLARVLADELPNTLHALAAGEITEWQATLVARETALLSREHRMSVDAELTDTLGPLGDRQVQVAAARIAYRLDPRAAVERTARAEHERRVSIRPAPECMTYVTALLPMAQGIAVHQSLKAHAEQTCAEHGGRGRAMADELVTRILDTTSSTTPGAPLIGQPETDTTTGDTLAERDDTAEDLTANLSRLPAPATIEIQLVMTDRTLFDGDQEPAQINGYGPAPAPLIRHLLRTAPATVNTFIRRVYTDPAGRLIGGDARRRQFPDTARQFLITRDQVCRTPWCDAPIRHADHIHPYATGGHTTLHNAQGLCARCNQTKQAAGWRSTPGPGGTIQITTPTGHQHRSDPPTAPQTDLWQKPDDLSTAPW